MRQKATKNGDRRKLEVRRETLRALDHRVMADHDLAQVAGGNTKFWPRRTCNCG